MQKETKKGRTKGRTKGRSKGRKIKKKKKKQKLRIAFHHFESLITANPAPPPNANFWLFYKLID